MSCPLLDVGSAIKILQDNLAVKIRTVKGVVAFVMWPCDAGEAGAVSKKKRNVVILENGWHRSHLSTVRTSLGAGSSTSPVGASEVNPAFPAWLGCGGIYNIRK